MFKKFSILVLLIFLSTVVFYGDLTIKASETQENCSLDTDGDGVSNCEDKCIDIFGEEVNSGCPIFIEDNTLGIPSLSNCEKSLDFNSYILGNVVCNSCPCTYSIDFYSNLKACDTLVPVLVNESEDKIYSKGKEFVLPDIF